jgi:hypothetical protein
MTPPRPTFSARPSLPTTIVMPVAIVLLGVAVALGVVPGTAPSAATPPPASQRSPLAASQITAAATPDGQREASEHRTLAPSPLSAAPEPPAVPGPPVPPEPPAVPAPSVRFETVDVYVDSGDRPLAAYQFTVTSAAGTALLAALEGGEHPAFAPTPYYDPAALVAERVVVAAFSTGQDLPRGNTRVARLHVQVTGDVDATYEATLQVAAGPDGTRVPATLTIRVARR